MTGASLTRRASSMVAGETWERSTSMPSRFISRTTSSPKRVRPSWPRLVVGSVRPIQGHVVGEGHVARAEVVVRAERAQRVLEDVPALHAEQRRDLARLKRARVPRPPCGEGQAVRDNARSSGARCRSARAARARSLGSLFTGDVDGPELPADEPLAQAREVGVAAGALRGGRRPATSPGPARSRGWPRAGRCARR